MRSIWVLFFINPFIATVSAVKNIRLNYSKNLIWAFITFLGLTWGLRPDAGADSLRYIQNVEDLSGSSIGVWQSYKSNGEIDFVAHIITVLVSRISGTGIVIMIIYGAIYGYFYSRNICYFTNRLTRDPNYKIYVLILALLMIIPFYNFNGFRFWTASHVFIFGLLPFLYERKWKSLFWCIFSIAFHFSFLFPVMILGVFLIVKSRISLYFYFFISSLIFTEFNITVVNNLIESYMPDVFADRSEAYRSVDYINKLEQASETSTLSWHAAIYNKVAHWFNYAMLILLYLKRKSIMKIDPRLIYIISFSLLLYGAVNFLSNIGSMGRFLRIAGFLAFGVSILYLANTKLDNRFKITFNMSVPLLLFFFVVSVRNGFYFISLTTILGNPVFALFTIGNNIVLDLILKG